MTNPSILFAGLLMAAIVGEAGQGAEPPGDGRALIMQSAANLLELPGLSADFRYEIRAYEQTLNGSGHYEQSGGGPDKLFRLELATQLAEHKATQLLVAGKQYLWIRRELGPDDHWLARVSLRRLRQAIDEAGKTSPIAPTSSWLGVVPLPKLLAALADWYVFEPAEATTLGGRPVLLLRGTMHSERRKQLQADRKGGGEQIPNLLEITLGTDDTLPLFPYRVQLTKRDKPEASPQPLLTVDFHAVKIRRDIPASNFEYFPGDQEVEDRTRNFIERLGLTVPADR
jgi:hypothetical protein